MTGASSGIGEAIARELAMLGVGLTLVARRSEELERLATQLRRKGAPEVEVLVADLTEPRGLAAVEARLADGSRPVDLLVNDAGLGTGGPFVGALHRPRGRRDRPQRRGRRTARPCGGGSDATTGPWRRPERLVASPGHVPAPNNATYAASKAFVTASASRSTRTSATPACSVGAVLPGFTRTEFQTRAEFDTSKIPAALWDDADTVARIGLDGVDRNKPVVVPTVKYRSAVALTKITPAALSRRLSGLFTE